MTNFSNPPIWPGINATFNFLSAVCLFIGWVLIKNKKVKAHKFTMCLAFIFSSIFLTCYLYYHFNYPPFPFQGQGIIRPIYFSILISHIVLAVGILPFIINLMRHAFAGRFEKHKKIARWIWPLWMYTSVTGILIYFMLYKWFINFEDVSL